MTLAIMDQSPQISTRQDREDRIRGQNADLASEFAKWMDMSPAEMIRAQYLADHDMTEEQLAALPPEERQKIEDDIEKTIKEKLGFDTKESDAALAGGTASLQEKLASLTLT